MHTVYHGLFTIPFEVIDRLCLVIVAIAGQLLYYFTIKLNVTAFQEGLGVYFINNLK